MSTNKTTNYNLHSWEPEDDFLRQEFNENFAALDAALHVAATSTATGSYVAPRLEPVTLDFGFRPRAVFFMADADVLLLGMATEAGGAALYRYTSAGSGVSSSQLRNLQFTDTGVVIPSSTGGINNDIGWTIHYLALR